MGVGKTTMGRILARKLGYDFFDVDAIVEKNSGVDINLIFELEQEEGFRKREQKALFSFAGKEKAVISTGGGIVKLKENCDFLKKNGIIIHLDTSFEILEKRLRKLSNRPMLLAAPNKDKLLSLHQERHKLYEAIADLTVNLDGVSSVKHGVVELQFAIDSYKN